ncbi:hypothetical protein HAX54_046365, partial [Datura stramonium]|nr:hypothetical protein [Datura stramonium]
YPLHVVTSIKHSLEDNPSILGLMCIDAYRFDLKWWEKIKQGIKRELQPLIDRSRAGPYLEDVHCYFPRL